MAIRTTTGHARTGQSRSPRPGSVRQLGLALAAGLAASVAGILLDRALVLVAGVLLTALAGLAALAALRRLQRELESAGRRRPDAGGHERKPVAGDAGDGLVSGAVNDLAARLRSTPDGDTKRAQALAETIERFVAGHGPETPEHTFRVGEMSRELGRLVGLPPGELALLRQAAPLHDVGQAGIPVQLLEKPGPLSPREFALVQRHASLGHRILSRSDQPALKAAAVIALQHHERWDGRGYPQGLAGPEIHLHARIVSLVDAFDAMFSSRAYRSPLSLDKALGIIRSQRGSHFDPQLVDLFLDNLPVFTGIVERGRVATPAADATARTTCSPSPGTCCAGASRTERPGRLPG